MSQSVINGDCGCGAACDGKWPRSGSFYSSTQSICPTCRKVIQGKYLFIENQVVLVKRCLEHGLFKSLVSSNVDYWLKSLSYTRPGLLPADFSTSATKGCPHDCGLCEDHEQHTCSPIIEISDKCDLKCPICIVWNKNSYDMEFDTFKKVVDDLIRKEAGVLDLLVLSGGEPTLHPEFFKLAGYAVSRKEIGRVVIASHGLRIARDEAFAKEFKAMGLNLSLQFDTLQEEKYRSIRGADLLKHKLKCLKRCEELDISTTIVPTIVRGFNDDEVGAVVDFALASPCVNSVTLQPMAYTGAGGGQFAHDPLKKLGQYDIHKLLQEQTKWARTEDFLPVLCSHPSCYSVCYVLRLDDGTYIPVSRFGDIADYLDALTNRSFIKSDEKSEDFARNSIYRLWSADDAPENKDQILKALKSLLQEYESALNPADLQRIADGKIKIVFVHGFMDEHDFDLSRVRKCCNHYVLSDGRLMPGCSYNTVHRV